MKTTVIGNLHGNILPPNIRREYKIRDDQPITISFNPEDCDEKNVFDTMIAGVQETVDDIKAGKIPSDIHEVLKAL